MSSIKNLLELVVVRRIVALIVDNGDFGQFRFRTRTLFVHSPINHATSTRMMSLLLRRIRLAIRLLLLLLRLQMCHLLLLMVLNRRLTLSGHC